MSYERRLTPEEVAEHNKAVHEKRLEKLKKELGDLNTQIQPKYKTRMDLVPMNAIREISKVFEFGAAKYEPYGWLDKEEYWTLLQHYRSTLHHLGNWQDGKTSDHESGLNNLYHAACRLIMMVELIRCGKAVDDRFKKD